MRPQFEHPLVSVVVTNYNYARFLGPAVDSVLAQTLRDLELVVVDDASADDSVAVLRRFTDRRVRILQQQTNVGYVRSYNAGLREARGKYIVSLDADDLMMSRKALELQVARLEDDPEAGLVFSDYAVIDGSGATITQRHTRVPARMPSRVAFRRLLQGNFVLHSGAMFRSTSIQEVGPHDVELYHAMDWEMWLRLSTRHAIVHIPESLYAYRLHDANMHGTVVHGDALQELHVVIDKAIAYAPWPEAGALRRRARASTFVLRANAQFAAGRHMLGFADLKSAVREHPNSLLAAGPGLTHLAMNVVFGSAKARVIRRVRAWASQSEAQRPLTRGSLRLRTAQFASSVVEVLSFVRAWPPASADEFDSANSYAELHDLARARPVRAFNGQVVRTKYLVDLFAAAGCTSFLETGTRFGATALSARYLFRRPVRTVEANQNAWRLARIAAILTRTPGVEFALGDSRQSLGAWLSDPLTGACPMIYLDAHWLHDHPLRGEIELTLARGKCVVVIDDAKVPHDAGFGFDEQNLGPESRWSFTVSLDAVRDLLPKDRVTALLPAYASSQETGLRQGTLLLLIDVAVPQLRDFAASLFREESI